MSTWYEDFLWSLMLVYNSLLISQVHKLQIGICVRRDKQIRVIIARLLNETAVASCLCKMRLLIAGFKIPPRWIQSWLDRSQSVSAHLAMRLQRPLVITSHFSSSICKMCITGTRWMLRKQRKNLMYDICGIHKKAQIIRNSQNWDLIRDSGGFLSMVISSLWLTV